MALSSSPGVSSSYVWGASPLTSSVINFLAWSPSSLGVTTDITTTLQNFLLYCQLVAYKLKSSTLDDQGQRVYVTAYLPRGYYNISCPLIVPELVNLVCDGIIIRNGSTGTITSNYTGNTTSKALANLFQPTVIIVPRAHSHAMNVYSNNDGVHFGAGVAIGKNWTVLSFAIGVTGSGYSVNDVLTCPNPSPSPYVAATATVTSVDGSGHITGINSSPTNIGAYGLPQVLQAQQWTSANGFSVFDNSGNFITTGGTGTGATLTPTWKPDWTGGDSTYYRGKSGLTADTIIEQCRIIGVPTTGGDATYGDMIAFNPFGLNFTFSDIELQGGHIGYNFNSVADIRGVNINSVGSSNAMVFSSANNIVCDNIVIDTPDFWVLSIDKAQGNKLSGRAFNRNRFNFAGSNNYPIIIGNNSSSGSGNNVEGLALDFQMTNCGSGGTPLGCPALFLANARGCSINLNITNFTSAGGVAPITSFVTFGSGVDSSNLLTGSIDGATSSLFSGSSGGCGTNVWNSGSGFCGSSTQRGNISGLTLSNDSGTPNSVLDIAAGQASDSTNLYTLNLNSSITKSTAGTWVVGTGQNGMGTGLTIANSTWYHVFLILNGTVDVYFDTSVTAANAPSGTLAFKRIGSFKTDGSAHIIAFIQVEETFYWATFIQDLNTTTLTNVSATLQTISTPLGVKTRAIIEANFNNNTLITSPDQTDVAPSTTIATLPGFSTNQSLTGGQPGSGFQFPYTNTSSQIRIRPNSNNATGSINTMGWIDSRGRLS